MALFNTGVAQARMVPSGSMAPTFLEGDRLLVVPYRAEVKRGEVLVFKPPFSGLPGTHVQEGLLATIGEDAPYVKRCVAIGGDTVEVKVGKGLFVNGRSQTEGYVLESPRYHWGPLKVPLGSLCMLGDNRNKSFDSHYWGFLPADRVVGRPTAVIWPLRRWRHL
jgi:signal peptidase I